MLIPGPKSPGMDIDIYLRPLILELKELWEKGVPTWDAAVAEPPKKLDPGAQIKVARQL